MVLDQILDVFTKIGDWIPDAVEQMIPIFWTAPTTEGGDGTLTFMGILAVAGLAFSVVFLVLGIIQRFLKFGA